MLEAGGQKPERSVEERICSPFSVWPKAPTVLFDVLFPIFNLLHAFSGCNDIVQNVSYTSLITA